MAFNLIHHFSDINSYKVSEGYLITSSKQNIKLYKSDNLEFIGTLNFNRYPTVLQLDEKSFLLQDYHRFLEISYSLQQKELFRIDLSNIWIIDIVGRYAFVKQEIDTIKNDFQIVKYNCKNSEVIWSTNCDSYVQRILNDKCVVIDSNNSKSLISLDIATGRVKWTIDLNSIFSDLYPSDDGECEIAAKPSLSGNTLIVQTQRIKSGWRYLIGLDLETGRINWHLRGYSNFELYNRKIYNIEFYGLVRIVNSQTGELELEVDLKDQFEQMQINCEHRFKVTDTHLYFKHGIKGKFGVLNLETLQLDEVQQLPDGNTMSTEEVPIVIGNRIYLRSAPQNNLFVYEVV